MSQPGYTRSRFSTLLLLAVGALLLARVQAEAQTNAPAGGTEFWPGLNATFELSTRFRLQTFAERRSGEDSDYLLWRVGTTFSYRAMRRIHRPDADIEEEGRHYIVLGGGYEYIRTYENGTAAGEHRVGAQFTTNRSAGSGLLLQDRNRFEFRWKDNGYNFRYRNKLMIDRPFQTGKVVLIPYASGELFWDRNAHAWNQRRYALGVRVPYQKSLMFDMYYLRKTCTDCTRSPVNAIGLTVGWYLRQEKR